MSSPKPPSSRAVCYSEPSPHRPHHRLKTWLPQSCLTLSPALPFPLKLQTRGSGGLLPHLCIRSSAASSTQHVVRELFPICPQWPSSPDPTSGSSALSHLLPRARNLGGSSRVTPVSPQNHLLSQFRRFFSPEHRFRHYDPTPGLRHLESGPRECEQKGAGICVPVCVVR